MDILGIGPLEIFFIIIIALIVLGPKDMAKAGRTIGRYLRMIVTSSGWQAVQQTSKELRKLPNRLIRDAGLDEEIKEFNSILPSNLNKRFAWKDLMEEFNSENPPQSDYQKESPQISQGTATEWITPPTESITQFNIADEWVIPPVSSSSDQDTADCNQNDQD